MNMVKRTLRGKAILLMLIISHISAFLEGHHWTQNSNPGMLLQVRQGDSTIVQKYMTHFLPKVADTTALGDRPQSQNFTIADPFWTMLNIHTFDTRFEWTDIQYQDHEVRLDQIQFKTDEYEGLGIFWLDFPAYKNVVIKAHQKLVHWLFGGESEIIIDIKDFDMDFKGILKLNEHGYLSPVVLGCDINFGESDVSSTSWIVEAFIYEVVHFSFIVIHNAAWITGPVMFTRIIGPVIDKYLNHYQLPLKVSSPIVGLEDINDQFVVDYRNTADPYHAKQYMRFNVLGEFFFQGQACKEWNPAPIPQLPFIDSYIALSETAVECMAEQFAKTRLSTLELNEDTLNKMFGKIGNTLTTSTLKETLPILEKKLGKDKPLDFVLGYKDMKFSFDHWESHEDNNFEITFTLLMGISSKVSGQKNGLKIHVPPEEHMYDEIQFQIAGSLYNGPRTQYRQQVDKDHNGMYTFGKLNKFQLDHTHGNRHQPYRNSLNLTKNEYLEFLSGLGVQMKKNKDFLNSILQHGGVVYPFNVPEFHQLLYFDKGAVYFVYTQKEYTEEEAKEFHDGISS